MLFVLVIIAGFLQMTVLQEVNLLVVLAIFLGLRKGPVAGFLGGALIGIFVEILSGCSFGLNLLLYTTVGLASGLARTRIDYKENIFIEFIFTFCGVCLFYFMYFILTKTVEPSIFFTILFSAIVSPLVFKIADANHRTT